MLKHMGYVIESRGAWLRAEARGVAVVLTISGRVDPTNVETVGGHLVRFVDLRDPLIVVMDAEVEGNCRNVLLDELSEKCQRVNVACILVAPSGAIEPGIRIADTVAAAAHAHFDDSRNGLLTGCSPVAPIIELRSGSQ